MSTIRRRYVLPRGVALASLLFVLLVCSAQVPAASADHTPVPTSVTIAGSLQSELGCPGDWQPDCAATHLTYDAADDVWQGSFAVPAGDYEYKAALNNSWTENYGLGGQQGGANIPLPLAAAATVKFYYDHKTHWVTANRTPIAVAAGSFQSELGCPGDWQPDCLRAWLQDPDGDGVFSFTTSAIPAGDYAAKTAINESWDENYGAGGAPGGADIPFSVPSNGATIEFRWNATTKLLTIGGTQKGNLRQAGAHWVSRDTIAWNAAGLSDTYRLCYDPSGTLSLAPGGVSGGQCVPLAVDPTGLPPAARAKFPHLAGYAALKLGAADLGKVPEMLKGELAVSATDTNGNLVDATGLQLPGVLDELYAYAGPLGVTYQGDSPVLRVWAPTAKSVTLHLFADANPQTTSSSYPMTWNAATGVWSAGGDPSWNGRYFLYEVQVYVRSTDTVERNMVTDPYSFSLAMNSRRSQIVDLSASRTKPTGWDRLQKPQLAAFEDIVLYELHVRDFSANDAAVPAAYKGTYKAFTVDGSNGMRHLAALAGAGMTHIHLLPVFDIASINENKAERSDPDPAVLAGYGPDSEEQQRIIGELRDRDSFNWGYDPYHYTVPEGSYATSPDGTARVVEFREMVQALNRNGLRVVMDVVYNHTSSSGQNATSVLDRIVPGYYHRLNAQTGAVEQSTCCENTATEHSMMEKLMLDSLLTWATQYKVDGFRFDLMGHHMVSNMLKVRDRLRSLTLENDGVDGSKIYLYGEGWNFGEVANNARGVNATQLNLPGSGIGTFSDRMRDAVRGGGPFSGLQEQGFATGLLYDPNATNQGTAQEQRDRLLLNQDLTRVGQSGTLSSFTFVDRTGATVTNAQVRYGDSPAGYTADPQEVINYVEAHDNETLFDAIQLKAPLETPMAGRVRMHNLANDTVMLAQGVPFFEAGQDLLRSKSLDRNSYNSGDWFNKLDWTYNTNNWGVGLPPEENRPNWPIMKTLLANPALKPSPADIRFAAAHFQELLRIRKSSRLFRLETADQVNNRLQFHTRGPEQSPGLIVMSISDTGGFERARAGRAAERDVDLDRIYERAVVLFNANDEAQTVTVPALAGVELRLHPVLRSSVDPVVREAGFAQASGTFSVPARTTAVFMEQNVFTGYLPAVDYAKR